MIGKIYKARTPFYDHTAQRMDFKARPVLVLAQADAGDYVVLPISTISIRTNVDPVYDIEIDPALYPKLHLRRVSYVRTHKQTTVNRANLCEIIGDLKADYEDLYLTILLKREAFSHMISRQAF